MINLVLLEMKLLLREDVSEEARLGPRQGWEVDIDCANKCEVY